MLDDVTVGRLRQAQEDSWQAEIMHQRTALLQEQMKQMRDDIERSITPVEVSHVPAVESHVSPVTVEAVTLTLHQEAAEVSEMPSLRECQCYR